METHIHTRIYKNRGSPAWKHTSTQDDIQATFKSQPKIFRFKQSCNYH